MLPEKMSRASGVVSQLGSMPSSVARVGLVAMSWGDGTGVGSCLE